VRDPDLKSAASAAFPTSFPVPPDDRLNLGDGAVDYGKSHRDGAHAL